METELFVHFAEIAGVFVGFGALISLRGARPTDPHDVVYLQAVLIRGLHPARGRDEPGALRSSSG